jgi:ERCC4-type nuclease
MLIPLDSTTKPARRTPQSDDPLVLPFVVQVDHRERAAGWRFAGLHADSADKYRPIVVPQVEVHLKTADYTIDGVPIFIERKSHEDVIGSISGGATNFRLEHDRMAALISQGAHCCVVIETSLDRVIDELNGESARRVSPAAVMGTVASYPMKYGVPWHWCGTRQLAEELALRILRKAYEHLPKKVINTG